MHTNRLKVAPFLAAVTALAILLSGCAYIGIDSSTATPTSTPTPLVVSGVRYARVSDAMFGFSLNIPAGLLNLGQQALPGSGDDDIQWVSPNANFSPNVQVNYGGIVAGLDPNQCPQALPHATIITIGHGITAYESIPPTSFPTPPPQASVGPPSYGVAFLWKGVDIQISLTGSFPYSTFKQRYAAIWQEMLASFMPGSYVNPHPVCGG